jgi:hypothetical protein
LKKFLFISSIIFLLSSCQPVEEGVYFEVDGKSYQTSENMSYQFGTATTYLTPPKSTVYFSVTYRNSIFKFNFITYSFNPGKYNCNELRDGSSLAPIPIVRINLEIFNSDLGWISQYETKIEPPKFGEDNYIEIINLDEKVLEIRFNIILKPLDGLFPYYPEYHLKVKNGYLKLYL